ncbi:MAG TPA: aromatic ring-hydroxylating dioxygenase subunit alpha [Chthonomonadales bacterium]|nr:aromatic ring-hydroxylating dioxygenase subunit alpha [Chthonomonadales bacterium]
MTGVRENAATSASTTLGKQTEAPALRGDIRHLIPKLGLREYWYPALRTKDVGRTRPKRVKMLGTDLCFFRGRDDRIVAVDDICPHRGARLSEGHCHYRGTVSCPYHGWTFDEHGRNIAVLSEGPDSRICGKPGTEVRVYPTQELKGVVFVWMGEGEPAPIEEDVPEEFFRDDLHVLTNIEYWPVNWELALENSLDSHVPYLHINAWWIMLGVGFLPFGAAGGHVPVWVGNGFTGERVTGPTRAYFPSVGGYWPKTNYRRLWTWLFRWYLQRAQRTRRITWKPQWDWGHHLPGMFRTGRPVFDHYSRHCVPIDENNTRVWYFHTAPARTAWQRLLHTLEYNLFVRFLHDKQFSRQDVDPMINQRYDTPEMLSVTDAEIVQWRRLVVTKHLGGRNAKFRFSGKSLVGKEGLADEEEERRSTDSPDGTEAA